MRTVLLLLFCISSPVWSQDKSISILPRYGVSTKNFNRITPDSSGNRYDYLGIQPHYDVGLNIDYNHVLWKKYGLFLTTGLDISQSTHYQRITETKYRIHLDNIVVKKMRLGFHLGVMKRFAFMDDRLLLDIGGSLVYRQFFKETKTYAENFQFNNEDWIEYEYTLTTFHGKWYDNNLEKSHIGIFGTELSALLKFNIAPQSYLNFGLSYTTRNSFFYDYQYTVLYYLNDSPTPTSTITNFGFIDVKYGSNDNFLYLNFGYTYMFKNREK